jgi:hypothetical protein
LPMRRVRSLFASRDPPGRISRFLRNSSGIVRLSENS